MHEPDPDADTRDWLQRAAGDVITDTEQTLAGTRMSRTRRAQWAGLRAEAIEIAAEASRKPT
jgi:hypothetical protein